MSNNVQATGPKLPMSGRDLFNQMIVFGNLRISKNHILLNTETNEPLAEVIGGRTYFRDTGKYFEIHLSMKSVSNKTRGFLLMEVRNITKKVKDGRKLTDPRKSKRDRDLERVEQPGFKV